MHQKKKLSDKIYTISIVDYPLKSLSFFFQTKYCMWHKISTNQVSNDCHFSRLEIVRNFGLLLQF